MKLPRATVVGFMVLAIGVEHTNAFFTMPGAKKATPGSATLISKAETFINCHRLLFPSGSRPVL